MFFTKRAGLKFIDAGDKAGHDFTVGDFTGDSSWHDLDLSSKVPANAKWVIMSLKIKGNIPSCYMEWASKSMSSGYPQYNFICQVANILGTGTMILPLDSEKKVQYRLQAAVTWAGVDVDIIAYAI